MASSAEEYIEVAAVYDRVSKMKLEPFAHSIVLQNLAVSYEQAASLSGEGAKNSLWTKASKAWQDLHDLNSKVFGLFALTQKARILYVQKDLKALKQAIDQLEKNGKASKTKDASPASPIFIQQFQQQNKVQSWEKEVKLYRALLKKENAG